MFGSIGATIVSVLTVKVPEEIKDKMRRTGDKVDWPREIRSFIEDKIEELERRERVEKVEQMLVDLPTQAKGTASKLLRYRRDSH